MTQTAATGHKMTFATLKRRIKVGTKLLCLEQTYRPQLVGSERVVVKAQTNGFWWTSPGDDRKSFTNYPKKASGVSWVDDDTFQIDLEFRDAHHVTLKFVG